ncbi:MAG: TrmH family RNA methyltransferase [Anaerolineae bacterium]
MDAPLLTSLSNPLVKQARALRQNKARAESGLFLIEGIHHVGEALEARWPLQTILYAPDLLSSEFAHRLLAQAAQQGIRLQPVSVAVMESLADKENPQGILAIARQKQITLSDLGPLRYAAALVSPQDPGNVGAILRTLDAIGADALFLLEGGVDLYHPTVVRASMGTLFWKPVVRTSFDAWLEWARGRGFQLIGTSAHADVDYQTLVPRFPWILVLGNEQKGLSPKQLAACDVSVSLPMRGRVSSLNLAIAAGVLLYRYAENFDDSR